MRRTVIVATLLAAALTMSVGCKKTKIQEIPTPVAVETAPAETPKEVTDDFKAEAPTVEDVEPSIEELNARGVLKTVYFDFDSSELRAEARSVLQGNSDWLKRNPSRVVEIGGHCDERGTIEYNLALGSRRANIVKDYLSNLGVTNRLDPVSYGEERPAEMGHGESAWSKNRRADFRIKS